MTTIRRALEERLDGAKRIAILGVGSDLRADDASGMLVADNIRAAFPAKKSGKEVGVFFGETAPENFTGEIKRFRPSHIIIIDTIDTGDRPGNICLFRPEDVEEGTSFSTHKMPARVLVDYLTTSCKCGATIIGIQPKTVSFGKPITSSVKKAVKTLSSVITQAIHKC